MGGFFDTHRKTNTRHTDRTVFPYEKAIKNLTKFRLADRGSKVILSSRLSEEDLNEIKLCIMKCGTSILRQIMGGESSEAEDTFNSTIESLLQKNKFCFLLYASQLLQYYMRYIVIRTLLRSSILKVLILF